MRQLTIIVIGLGLAFAAAAMVSVLQSGLSTSPSADASSGRISPSGPDERIVAVLARDLPAGHRLVAEDLSVEVVPAEEGLADVVETPRTVVGRVLIASGVKGEILRRTNLALPGTGASIAAQLEPGDRAATVTLSDVGSKVILYPGARVDVLATMQVLDDSRQRRTYTGVILEDRRVLAVDDEIAGGGSTIIEDDGRRRTASRTITVTLAVRPGEIERLELASEQGTIGLVLRPMEDAGSGAGPGVSPETLFGGQATSRRTRPSAPSSARPATPTPELPDWWEVVVVRDGKEEPHRFREGTEGSED
ncbi:MAG: Flp pilus assembly protein CpaB [Planctomycetota bacterium]|nr:Flp pilus assembly protein CpaB [Planctomycetota bacterium]MEE2895739.1 Flp pilus assembly protein CpaB [Planctomycetota bacterium]